MKEVSVYVGCSADGFKTVDEAIQWIYKQTDNVRYIIHCHSSVEVD